MKRILWLLLLTTTTFLTACDPPQEDPPPIDNTGCDTNQLEIDGDCVTLTGPELQLLDVLNSMPDYTSYMLSVVISEPTDIEHTVVLSFDGTTSLYDDGYEQLFTEQDGSNCILTTVAFGQVSKEEMPCPNTSTRIYEAFTYDMFTLDSGLYHLNSDSLTDVEATLSDYLNDMSLISLTMMIGTDNISELVFQLQYNEELYTMTMTFEHYNDVDITVPSEVSEQ